MTSIMKDILAVDFQTAVDQSLTRNRNLLDTISKHQVAAARLSRAITKAATQCGCISIAGTSSAGVQPNGQPDDRVSGALCKSCRAMVEKEMGDLLYYTAALCNALDLSLYDVLLREKKTVDLLGNFNLK